jgi:allophanate hydrolase subunit 2
MDPEAFRAAQAAVGNSPGQAAVEFAAAGLSLRAEGEHLAAVAEDGKGPQAFRWTEGETLRLDPPRQGVWAYLAVAGGIATPGILGSRSVLPRAGFGAPLRAGDRLPVGEARGVPGNLASRPRLEGVLGVRIAWTAAPFGEAARQALLAGTFSPSSQGDRMGYRLQGPRLPGPFPPARSLPTVAGALQVTPDGRIIVLMADRQTTGGYPTIAVAVGDLGRLAQRRPGEPMRFLDPGQPESASRSLAI